MAKGSDDQYGPREAKRRFEAALRGGLSTPPRPLKEVSPKPTKPKRARKASAPKSA